MDNIDPLLAVILFLISLLLTMKIIIIFVRWLKRWRKRRRRLWLQVTFHNTKHPFFMSLNTVTLTDLLPHTGVISVADQNGNAIAGKLSNIQVSVADPSVDSSQIDPTKANTLDVTAKTSTGGTTLSLTADFVADSPVNGQTTFPGLKGTVTVINNVTTQLSLQVNF